MLTDVKSCARCGGDHIRQEFKELEAPCDFYTHWSMCPTNDEPIMLRIVEGYKVGDEVELRRLRNRELKQEIENA